MQKDVFDKKMQYNNDNMLQEFEWDGPEDSDEEIQEMAKYKTKYELDQGIKFSKRGIIDFIEKSIENE